MKKALALLLALTMIFALCACGQQAKAEEITINFPSVWVGTDSKAPYMEQLIAKFNEENAGKIKVVVEEQTDYQAGPRHRHLPQRSVVGRQPLQGRQRR